MAGYFQYLGRVFTEKGSWYKLVTMSLLCIISTLFAPSSNLIKALVSATKDAIPGLILYMYVAILIYGFFYQVYANCMQDRETVLPELDFAGMFIKFIRFLPFCIVWSIYLIIVVGVLIFFFGFMPAFRPGGVAMNPVVFVAVAIIIVLLYQFTMPILTAIHAKSFSYRLVLNPFAGFVLFPRLGLQAFLLYLLYICLCVALGIGFFAYRALIGVLFRETISQMSRWVFMLLALPCFYVMLAFVYAFQARLCDIIKTRLEDTDYLYDEFETASESEDYESSDDEYGSGSDDSLDY